MTRDQRFAIGFAAGLAGLLGGRHLIRSRHAIDFGGRTVVITGGSRGLGLVMARQLAAEGARVCLLARDSDELERAKSQVLACGGSDVMPLPCDVRSKEAVAQVVEAILEERGAIDVLINNAGMIQVGPLEHMTADDFDNAMATHFWGPLHMMQACLPSMRRRGFGRIVNISSIGGRLAAPHLAPYSASKFALVGLSDAVRAEVARYGIRVTTVAPGLMRTGSPINAQIKGQHDAEFTWFAIADALPGLSVSAERAAEQIVDACRYGDPELTIGSPAKAAVIAAALAPGAVARMVAASVGLLPGPTGASGDMIKPGRGTRSEWAPSVLTTLSDRAAEENNEL